MHDILVQPLERIHATRPGQIEASACARQGEKRETNEDSVFCRTGQLPDEDKWMGLYIVCDGLGGHAAGEIASRLAVETLSTELADLLPTAAAASRSNGTQPSQTTVDDRIRQAIKRANAKIYEFSQTHPIGAGNLGTTVTLALLDGTTVHIANVGDSRTYAVRAGEVMQITDDHSMAAKLVEAGVIAPDSQAAPPRHIIYKALGIAEAVEPDLFRWDIEPGDKLMLCSDGLWQTFPDKDELARWLGPETAAGDLCKQLVGEAYRRDGSDDTSAVVVVVR